LAYPIVSESWKIKLLRWKFNRYPAYRQSGARVVRISEDFREITVRLPLNRTTRNLHGTIYGGAMYAAVDPLHAVIVASHLGPDFHVWTKSAQIDFKRPGSGDLVAQARVTGRDLEEIRAALEHAPKIDRDFALSLTDEQGNIAAHVRLTIHIKRRAAHEHRMNDVVFARPA
jgi:acyl-coenzyme A thioesterase PaaI-like protein